MVLMIGKNEAKTLAHAKLGAEWNKVMEKIYKTALVGAMSVSIYESEMNDKIIHQLRSMGYKVNYEGFMFVISWSH